jgi:hypothetical protein
VAWIIIPTPIFLCKVWVGSQADDDDAGVELGVSSSSELPCGLLSLPFLNLGCEVKPGESPPAKTEGGKHAFNGRGSKVS